MRDFLIGLFGLCVFGCVPDAGCDWVEFTDLPAYPPPAGKCAMVTIGATGRITKAPAVGCDVDEEPTKCVILMGDESAAAFLPDTPDRVIPGGRVPGTRTHAPLNEDGSCPLVCE